MKVKFAGDTTLQAVGVQGTSAFNIATTAHMFHILSSGLYSDKVTAVLRELGCNAMDAHIMSGQPNRPFEVKLPTKLDPTFHIKDWGPGLDHAEVTELYTTYGMSTKQYSNDATGAFGLGSKSPFAYADLFSIVAVKDGVRRVYTAHKENDSPVISLQSEGPAEDDWTHGVMVSLPVAPSDSEEFKTKALSVFRWFSTLPSFLGLGARELEAAVPTFQFTGTGYAFGSNRGDDKTTVVMGNVAYPLDVSRIEGATELHQLFSNAGIHLWMPLGSVMPTPSRESLQYDKDGQRALAEALNEAGRDFARRLLVELRALERTGWDYGASVRKLLGKVRRLTWQGAGVKILTGLMREVSAGAEDLANLEKALKSDYFEMPRWVARWSKPPTQVMSVAGLMVPVLEIAGPPCAEEVEQMRLNRMPGLTVQYLTLREDRNTPRVSARTVVAGCVEMKSDREALRVPFDEDMRVYFTDCSYGVQRVRQHLVEHGVERAMLVSGPKKCWDDVKAYAEALAGPMGMDMSAKPVAASSLGAVQIRRYGSAEKVDAAARLARYGEEEVEYFDLIAKGRWTHAKLKDLDDDAVYYVEQTNRSSRSWRVTCSLGAGRTLRHNELETALGALRTLALKCGDLWTGPKTIILARTAQLKRLQKFYQDGLKPVAPAIRDAFESVEVLKTLAGQMGQYPVLRLDYNYDYQQAGAPGLLAAWLFKKSSGAQEFVRRFPDSCVVQEALALQNARDSKAVNGGCMREVVSRVEVLVPNLMSRMTKHVNVVTAQDIAQKANEQYPFAAYLNLPAIFNMSVEDFETALPMLETVFGPAAPVPVQALAA